MTISTVFFLKKFGISMAVGALLLSASPLSPSKHTAAADGTAGLTRSADLLPPDTLHHWPNAVVADLDPATLHHWETIAVADFDPDTLHHWGSAAVTVADLDPLTLHHWA